MYVVCTIKWVRETAEDVRIYIIYGHSDTHLGNYRYQTTFLD